MEKITKNILNALNESAKKEQDDRIMEVASSVYEHLLDVTDMSKYGVEKEIKALKDIDYLGMNIDCDDLTELNKAVRLVRKALRNIDYGNDNIYYDDSSNEDKIEISDNHTLWNVDLPDDVYDVFDDNDLNELWNIYVENAINEMSESDLIEGDVQLLGRMGRHVVVDNNFTNAYNFYDIQNLQEELENATVKAYEEDVKKQYEKAKNETPKNESAKVKKPNRDFKLKESAKVKKSNRNFKLKESGNLGDTPNIIVRTSVKEYKMVRDVLRRKRETDKEKAKEIVKFLFGVDVYDFYETGEDTFEFSLSENVYDYYILTYITCESKGGYYLPVKVSINYKNEKNEQFSIDFDELKEFIGEE